MKSPYVFEPEYVFRIRQPKPGELVHCLFSVWVWRAIRVHENGGVVVGRKIKEDGSVTEAVLNSGDYHVLEKNEENLTNNYCTLFMIIID